MSSKNEKTMNGTASTTNHHGTGLAATDRYRVRVPGRFILVSLLTCILVAFAIGRTARLILLINPQVSLLLEEASKRLMNETPDRRDGILKLPTPILAAGKILPKTTYTSKAFDTARSTINSRWVVTEEGRKQCVDLPDHQCQVPEIAANHSFPYEELDDGEVHLPSGQHLLIDIAHVDGAFLDSEERLATAMMDMVNECGLTLLSYHCHGLVPSGVSCAGVLLESHVSFHTWPSEGVITLDLFTCGDQSLLPIVPLAEKLFAVPRVGSSEKPQMIWAHKFRGFSDNTDEVSELTDLFNFPIGLMTDYKHQVCSVQTNFQRVDVVDVLLDHHTLEEYERSQSNDGSYESKNPQFFQPDRLVFLDGVMQSRRTGDAAYHEALVHPGMFVAENPKRVAIIGGGEGATLREVLKHKTVEKVIMIEIDEIMVSTSRKFLPEWSDCSFLEGSADSCFDDPRVEVYYEDAFAWFIDRYGGSQETPEPFDVVIMDALDPQIQKAFVDALYDGGAFLHSLPTAIADDGVLIAQVGEVPRLNSPPEHISLNKNRVNFIRSLSDLGFGVVRDYQENLHASFEAPWQFIVASKSFDTMERWVADPSMIEYNIRKRLLPTKDGQSPLLFFDGGTMMTFAFPSKASEKVFCRRHPNLANCETGHGFNHFKDNLPVSSVRVATIDGRRGVFAARDIPQMSYVGLEEALNGVYVKPSASALLNKMTAKPDSPKKVSPFIDTFGFKQRRSDLSDMIAQTSIHAFINEGCKELGNMGLDKSEEEEDLIYNPMRDRQIHIFHTASPNADIPEGKELLYRSDGQC